MTLDCLFQTQQSQLRMNYLSVKKEISRSPFHPIISIPLKIISLHCDILKCVIINFSPEKTEVVRIDGSKKKKMNLAFYD